MISNQYVSQIRLQLDPAGQPDGYPFSLPAVRHLAAQGELALHPTITFVVGENGSGKSTLLEAMAVAYGFNAEGGTRNFDFGTRASHSALHEHIKLVKGYRQAKDGFFLRAESFFNVATEIDKLGVGGSYGGTSLHEQSHGESFWSLVMHRFGGHGFYILDEPEAALSPQRQLALLARIHELVNDDSQFVIATHSPILMAYPDARIYACSGEGIHQVAYRETEHFQVMHDFMVNPDRMLDVLLDRPKVHL